MQRLLDLYCITVCYYLHMFYCKLHTVPLMLGNHKQRKPHLSILTTSINTDYLTANLIIFNWMPLSHLLTGRPTVKNWIVRR